MKALISLLLAPTLILPALARTVDSVPIDFSHCGFQQSDNAIPQVTATLFVEAVSGDATPLIQAAIDHVATLPLLDNGFRGAILLDQGTFEIAGQLRIPATGIVLRGSGKTTLKATGPDRRALIRVVGEADASVEDQARAVVEDVAVGSRLLPLDSVDGLQVGDRLRVTRPSTEAWISAIGMDRFLIGWRPGSRDIVWEREITAIDGQVVHVDAPITTALEKAFGGGRVQKVRWPGRISNVGIEQLELLSAVSSARPSDEDHAWTGITMENVQDAWIRQVRFRQFAGSAVMLWESASQVSVVDCLSLDPISEMGGHRRDAFFTMGQGTLFLRCWSENGRRDFTVGHAAAGPIAFVACESSASSGDSGPVSSWASGILYDNVKIDGGHLRLDHRWVANHAAGWAAANSVLWQCAAAEIHCFQPPTAQNAARGVWGRYIGDGDFQAEDEFVSPNSLFQAQLSARGGIDLGPIGNKHFGATNPSYEQAEAFVRQSHSPAETLRARIESASQRDPIPSDRGDLPEFTYHPQEAAAPQGKHLTIDAGRLLIGEQPAKGKRKSVPWWRGNTRPHEAPKMGPAITRFVPGRVGMGFTDDLSEVVHDLVAQDYLAIDHNYGLWYDRRSDDHVRVRRADGGVLAPFYEQPFARSGDGRAWDGLSRYDLEKPNPWYWDRLRQFATLADEAGVLLYHQHYFQHNLLEAGAHWSDCPWRTANNVNDPGFPEPPPYISDKRIFQAHLFYDVTHPERRRLHQQYIRQGLENFADTHNVIHFTGAEYTGPLSFMQFWVDTIRDWESETGKHAWVALSCTKDVQDAILADPLRAPTIDIIDIRYWSYVDNGGLYAPPGGKNLAPRQHQRRNRAGKISNAAIARSVDEYRERYPDKAVLYKGEPR